MDSFKKDQRIKYLSLLEVNLKLKTYMYQVKFVLHITSGWVKISQSAPRQKIPMFWRSGAIVEKKTLKDLPFSVKPYAANAIPILKGNFKKYKGKF